MTKAITAFFDTLAEAERAAHDLATRVGGVRGEVYDARRSGELSRLSIAGEDMATYHEGVRRGGAVFHAQVPDHLFEEAADVLENHGAVDIGEREAAWRREGWTGAAAQPTTGTTQRRGRRGPAARRSAFRLSRSGCASASATPPTAASGCAATCVETPVQEQVTLREEHVKVERRPVDRPIAAGDDAFRERTVEATERAEEAVVSKEARVKEEVVVRKQAEERTETVSDTVRRTEVEVEDERGRSDEKGRPNRV